NEKTKNKYKQRDHENGIRVSCQRIKPSRGKTQSDESPYSLKSLKRNSDNKNPKKYPYLLLGLHQLGYQQIHYKKVEHSSRLPKRYQNIATIHDTIDQGKGKACHKEKH